MPSRLSVRLCFHKVGRERVTFSLFLSAYLSGNPGTRKEQLRLSVLRDEG